MIKKVITQDNISKLYLKFKCQTSARKIASENNEYLTIYKKRNNSDTRSTFKYENK